MRKILLTLITISLLFPMFSMAISPSDVCEVLSSEEVKIIGMNCSPEGTMIEQLEYVIGKLYELVDYYSLQILNISSNI